MRLEGKIGIITGGSCGIGKQIALTFAKEGARIAVLDINIEEGNKVAEQTGGKFYHCDLRYINGIEPVFKSILDDFGAINILVNSAGLANRTTIENITEEEWDLLNNVNLKSVFFASKQAYLMMRGNGMPGKIINIASLRGMLSDGRHTIYDATKAGVLAMTRSFAVACAKDNIQVNAICPGYVLTPMTEHNLNRKDWYEWICGRIPMGRLTEMQEVADAALFLASDESRGMTGQHIVVDGGWSIHN